MIFVLFLFIRSSIMIDDSKKKQAHRIFISNFRVPSRFVRHRLDIIKKKSKGIYPFVLIYFPMLIFTRTYIRNQMPHTCYFSKCLYFYILRFDSQFKIKEFISYEIYIKGRKKNNQRYYAIRTYFALMINMKIILPLMARTYQVCFKLFL